MMCSGLASKTGLTFKASSFGCQKDPREINFSVTPIFICQRALGEIYFNVVQDFRGQNNINEVDAELPIGHWKGTNKLARRERKVTTNTEVKSLLVILRQQA